MTLVYARSQAKWNMKELTLGFMTSILTTDLATHEYYY